MDQEQDRQELASQLDSWETGDGEDPMQPSPQPHRKRFLMVAGALALVLLLGGAAYQGGKMLAGPAPVEGAGAPLALGGSGGKGANFKSFKLERSDELPQAAPDVAGILVGRADNSLTVASNTGGGVVVVKKSGGSQGPESGSSGKPALSSAPGVGDGPKVEVVVTRETKVYRDVTEFSIDKNVSDAQVKQEVEPATIEDIPDDAFVSVWGEKRGDRVVATVISFQQ